MKVASPNQASPVKVASPNRASPVKVAPSNPARCLKVAPPNRASPVKVAPPNRASPVKVALPNRASPVKVAPPNPARRLKVAPPNPARRLKVAPPNPARRLKVAPPNPASPVKVAPPNPASPVKVASPNWQFSSSGSSFAPRGAAVRIRSRRVPVMGTPRASIVPVSLISFSAAAVSSSLAWARHSRAEASRMPTHPAYSHTGHSTSVCSAIRSPWCSRAYACAKASRSSASQDNSRLCSVTRPSIANDTQLSPGQPQHQPQEWREHRRVHSNRTPLDGQPARRMVSRSVDLFDRSLPLAGLRRVALNGSSAGCSGHLFGFGGGFPEEAG